MIFFLNISKDIYKCISTKMDDLTKRIVEAGGKVSLNLNSCVTHVLSSDRKGMLSYALESWFYLEIIHSI